ncbi:MAG: cytochrome b N-terminal domain-containing protein, partial [Solirubrobacterales bacterium]
NGNGNGAAPEGPTKAERRAAVKTAAIHHSAEGGATAAGWVDERVNGSGIYTALLTRKVPKGTNWFYTLGSATMFIFAMQAITGVFLSMYYTPSATQAYASITHLTNDVFMGEFVRGMHKWGGSLMIILIFLHMARTFFFGAYKYPRELNWVIGVVLIVLTMVMGLTGYLLPFDQRSFWATIVANNITASGPVVGPYLADFLRAGPDFSATTLSRFYALHMLLVPGLIGGLIAAHLFLVIKLGTTAPPWVKAARPKGARPIEFVPAGVPAPEGLPTNGAVTNGAVTNGAVTNGSAPMVPTTEPAEDPPAGVVAAEATGSPDSVEQPAPEATEAEITADSPDPEGPDGEVSA